MTFPELTYKNHFQFGYDGAPFGRRVSKEQNFYVSYGVATRRLSFLEACIEQAKMIHTGVQGPIGVLFSGGIDSEAVVQSFVKAECPVTAYIGRMKYDYNVHDICYAIIACEKYGVPYRIIDYDFEKMISEKGESYAELSQCFSPQLIAVMYLMDQVSEYVVLGGGDCVFRCEPLGGEWFLCERERVASWYKFLIARRRNSCPGFFQYTPEVIAAYANDPFVIEKMNENRGCVSPADFKLEFLQCHFDLMPRKKMTGFEKIQNLDYRFRSEFKKKYLDCDQTFKTAHRSFLWMGT